MVTGIIKRNSQTVLQLFGRVGNLVVNIYNGRYAEVGFFKFNRTRFRNRLGRKRRAGRRLHFGIFDPAGIFSGKNHAVHPVQAPVGNKFYAFLKEQHIAAVGGVAQHHGVSGGFKQHGVLKYFNAAFSPRGGGAREEPGFKPCRCEDFLSAVNGFNLVGAVIMPGARGGFRHRFVAVQGAEGEHSLFAGSARGRHPDIIAFGKFGIPVVA